MNNDFMIDEFSEEPTSKKHFSFSVDKKKIFVLAGAIVFLVIISIAIKIITTPHYNYELNTTKSEIGYVGQDTTLNITVESDNTNIDRLVTEAFVMDNDVVIIEDGVFSGTKGSITVSTVKPGRTTIYVISSIKNTNNDGGTVASTKAIPITVY